MDQGSLVREELEAGAELVRGLDPVFPVNAAFWIKDSDEGHWFLYLASDQINYKNMDVAYGEVLRVAAEMANPDLDAFLVKLIPASHPLAQAALEIHRQYPSKSITRLGGMSFGGMAVDRVYLYPPAATVSAS